MLFSLGYFQIIDKASHISTQTAILIDNVFTNVLNVYHKGRLLLPEISYQIPVILCFQ